MSRGERGAAAMLEAAEARLEELLDGALENGGGSDDFDAAFGGGGDYDDDGGDGSGSSGGGDEGGSGGKPKAAAAAVAGGGEDEPPPPSFSRVDLSLPAAELKRRFPLFPGAGAAVVAEVAAGQCLYLPAGWFHEVTSYSEPGEPRRQQGLLTLYCILSFCVMNGHGLPARQRLHAGNTAVS